MDGSLRVFGDEDEKAHETQNRVFEPGIVVEPNCKHPHIGQVKLHLAHYLVSVQPICPSRVQPAVVDVVVVPLGQQVQVPVSPNSLSNHLGCTVITRCTIGIAWVLRL
jgi:hypothetical protein